MAFRNQGEPANRPLCYPALVGAQVVVTGGPASPRVVVSVIGANKGASAANLTVTDSQGQIGSVVVPAGDTETLFVEPGASFVGTLTVTTSAALDVTVVVA